MSRFGNTATSLAVSATLGIVVAVNVGAFLLTDLSYSVKSIREHDRNLGIPSAELAHDLPLGTYVTVKQIRHPKLSGPARRVVGKVAKRAVLDLDEAVGVWQEHLAGRGEPNLSSAPGQQLHAELALEGLDPLRQRRLRDVERRRRPAEVSRGGDLKESPQLPQFQCVITR